MIRMRIKLLVLVALFSFGLMPACFISSDFSPKSPPIVVTICPAAPATSEDLTVDFDGNCVVDTAESSQVLIQWSKNQKETGNASEDNRVLIADQTQKGQVWSAKVYNLQGDLLAQTASVTIQNSPPSIEQLSVMPSNPTSADSLTAVVTGEFDPDGDLVRLEHLWETNELEWTEAELPANLTVKGQRWKVTVTPVDDEGLRGESLQLRQTVIIENTPPAGQLSLTPPAPNSSDDIVASVNVSDPDNDEFTIAFTWEHPTKTTVMGATLSASLTERGETWEAVAEISDGTDPTVVRKSVIIGNVAPSVTMLAVEPVTPKTTDDLRVMFDLEDSDNETNELYARVVWEEQTGTTKRYRGRTLTSTWTAKSEEWKVIVTPFDSESEGLPAEEMTVIVNSSPVITALSIYPSEPRTGLPLTANIQTFDADNDDVSFLYSWNELTGTNKTVTNMPTLAASNTLKDERWQLTVTPKDVRPDGTLISEGQARTSSVVTVVNTPPVAGVVVAEDSILYAHGARAFQQPYCVVTQLGDDVDLPNDQLTHTLQSFAAETGIESFINTTVVTSTGIVETNGYDFAGRGLPAQTEIICRMSTEDQAGERIETSSRRDICVREYFNSFESGSASGSGDHVDLAPYHPSTNAPFDYSYLDMSPNGTIEAFVFWDGTQGGYLYNRWESGNADIWINLNRLDGSSFNGYGQVEAYISPSPGLEVRIWRNIQPSDRNYNDNSLNRLLEPGTWNHVALQWRTVQSGNRVEYQIRVNGRVEGTAGYSSGAIPSFQLTTPAYLGASVARGGRTQSFGGFDGAISDFRMSNIARYRDDWGQTTRGWKGLKNFLFDTDTQVSIGLGSKTAGASVGSYTTTGTIATPGGAQPVNFELEAHAPVNYRCLSP